MIKSIVRFLQLTDRLDAEYYKPEILSLKLKLDSLNSKQLSEFVTYNSRGIQPIYHPKSEFRVLTSQYITKDGIDDAALPSITQGNFKQGVDSKLAVGDILIYTTGANVGN